MKKEKSSSTARGFLLGVLSTLVVLGVVFTAWNWDYITGSGVAPANLGGQAKVSAITQMIHKVYLGDVDEEQLTDYMCLGLVTGLGDKYSTYYTEAQYEKLLQSNSGHYSGLGIEIKQETEGGDIQISKCYDNTPAADAGIKEGDILRSVDETSVEGLSSQDVVDMIQKKAQGDSVSLTLQRGEETYTAKVKISDVESVSASGRMLDAQTGYIQITEFTGVTSAQFQECMKNLRELGMKKLIIDLRDNGGGLVTGVCNTLRQILPEGLIVYTEDKNGKRTEERCDGDTPLDIPLVVLVNKNTASAAEIFSGAVQDYKIGTILGTVTYGKGVVQDTYPLKGGGAVKLTISHYYTPNGNNINGTGITPDVKLDQAEDASEDIQLAKAQEILAEK